MQLVAYGAQDIYLTGNPQITFFKVVYRRHTNFSMESIEQTFNGQADFGRKVTCTISRNGDLIHRVYLQATLPAVTVSSSNCDDPCPDSGFRWVNCVGQMLIKNVEVEIGGQRIDKHYGEWLNIWSELSTEPGHQAGYQRMIGNVAGLTGCALPYTDSSTLYIPLQFWFCRNPGLALPLIALQYHEVKINLEFRDKKDLYVVCPGFDTVSSECSSTDCTDKSVCVPSLESASLYVDYIYLDTDERRRFAQVSHEYLIEQLQFTGDETINSQSNRLRLNFNHPCKELIWVVRPNCNVTEGKNQWTNYSDQVVSDGSCVPYCNANVGMGFQATPFGWTNATGNDPCNQCDTGNEVAPVPGGCQLDSEDTSEVLYGNMPLCGGKNPVKSAKLQLNGHDRFSERAGSYFNLVQPYQHHTNCPSTGINVYSFALKPEEHQPSGTCNMSRIDNATLHLQVTEKAAEGSTAKVFATNYNVLRIMSGMGGLAYSN
jgi:hypothetical protein